MSLLDDIMNVIISLINCLKKLLGDIFLHFTDFLDIASCVELLSMK